jgi:hypothetical protein
MSAPERLLDNGRTSETARALLGAARDEQPSSEALGRTVAAMTAAVAGVSTASTTTTTSPPNAAAHLATISVKWIGVSSLALMGGLAGWLAWSHGQPPAPPTTDVVAATTAPPSPSEMLPTSAQPSPSAIAPPAGEAPRHASPATMSAASAPVAAASVATPGDSLASQVAALDSARNLLAAGDASGCIVALDRLQRDYPRTPLAQEAVVLRVQALVASGRTSQARALAARFLAAHPDSPYATRLRTATGDANFP